MGCDPWQTLRCSFSRRVSVHQKGGGGGSAVRWAHNSGTQPGSAWSQHAPRYLFSLQIPLSEGARGASTAENTESLASSMSCCEKLPDLAHSTAFANDWSVSVECGSLGDPKSQLLTHSPMKNKQQSCAGFTTSTLYCCKRLCFNA